MKASNVKVPALAGIDQRIPAAKATAAEMENWRSDWETGGWTNRLGYEKLLTSTSTFAPFTTFGRIDSVFCWSQRSAALRWLLMETGGVLYFVNYRQNAVVTLESDRRRYAVGEPSTSFVPTQSGVIIANGSRIKRFNGWCLDLSSGLTDLQSRYVSHGYDRTPQPPRAYSVQSAGTGVPNFTTDLEDGHVTNAVGEPTQDVGLGSRTDGHKNEYAWRVSWVDQTGSESALSAPSSTVRWTTGTEERGKICAVEIPRGPLGTVARRVYRTGYSDGLFRFVAEVSNNVELLFYDNSPDIRLGGAAPDTLTAIPSPSARFAAQAANCLFIDGGPSNALAVFYSMPGTSAQFSLEDFVYLGGDGGDVTGLAGYYNAVIVFRERQVDVITGTYPNFRVAPLLLDAGGRAPGTAVPVPGHGIMFLADDGVYSLTGGLDGGSKASIEIMSAPIEGYISRINPSISPSSKAVLCRKWKEYQLWIAIDGASDYNIGLIYHYDRKQWTVRTGFPVACVTSTPEGRVIFGHQAGANGNPNLESGLFVMSEARQMGHIKSGEQFIGAAPPTSLYLSRLESLGDSVDKKHLRYVYVNQMTAGSNTTAIQAEGDRGLVVNAGTALASQPADRSLLTTFTTGISNETGLWDSAQWVQPVPTDVRYSVVLNGSGYVQFRLSTANDIALTGYTLGVLASATEVIEGRAANTRRPT
jgi:hypothetical protein